jgi:hypothetical protein
MRSRNQRRKNRREQIHQRRIDRLEKLVEKAVNDGDHIKASRFELEAYRMYQQKGAWPFHKRRSRLSSILAFEGAILR